MAPHSVILAAVRNHRRLMRGRIISFFYR